MIGGASLQIAIYSYLSIGTQYLDKICMTNDQTVPSPHNETMPKLTKIVKFYP